MILAGGPSLTKEQAEYCRGRAKVVVINNSYAMAPWADVLYFCDDRWFRWHYKNQQFRSFAGEIVTLENTGLRAADKRIHSVRRGAAVGLSDAPDTLNTGSNGGYQCINLAVHAGASRIVLLGYDMRAVDGRVHWHPEHKIPTPSTVFKNVMLPKFASLIPGLAKLGIEVINATPGSALDCFPRDTLENALKTNSSGV